MSSKQNKIRIYVDMDDVLCNFSEAHFKAYGNNPGIEYPQSQYGFFANLEPKEDGVETVKDLMRDFDVWILSRPSYKNPLCYTEKRVWIEKHFGLEFCKKLILCSDKSLLKGDYLIDDCPWPEFEGKQLLFGSEEFKTWGLVKFFFEAELLRMFYE